MLVSDITPVFAEKNKTSQITGLSTERLKRLRLDGTLIEGIHWHTVSAKTLLFNVPLVLDWIANMGDATSHRRAIETFSAGLPSNQKRGKR